MSPHYVAPLNLNLCYGTSMYAFRERTSADEKENRADEKENKERALSKCGADNRGNGARTFYRKGERRSR